MCEADCDLDFIDEDCIDEDDANIYSLEAETEAYWRYWAEIAQKS